MRLSLFLHSCNLLTPSYLDCMQVIMAGINNIIWLLHVRMDTMAGGVEIAISKARANIISTFGAGERRSCWAFYSSPLHYNLIS
jgi:hypothetical protein